MLLSFFFFKQKTAYEMRISDWSSDVCSSDLIDKALAEGYRRNHAGDYADAAEFFEALSLRALGDTEMTGLDPSEFTLNRALQKSNLGEFAEADRLFADALALPTSDPVQLRLRRNFRAIHALNPIGRAHV